MRSSLVGEGVAVGAGWVASRSDMSAEHLSWGYGHVSARLLLTAMKDERSHVLRVKSASLAPSDQAVLLMNSIKEHYDGLIHATAVEISSDFSTAPEVTNLKFSAMCLTVLLCKVLETRTWMSVSE